MDILLEGGGYTSSFGRIAYIGDSLTNGNCDYNIGGSGEYVNDSTSYPSIVSRICGNIAHKMARGGSTAAVIDSSSWLTRADRPDLDWWNDSNISDAYIIALGTNDLSKYGEFSGNVNTDIDVNNISNNANTSVGGYGSIIMKIKEKQPKARIFCLTIPNTRNENLATARRQANEKIRAIVNLFDNCYCIDLEQFGVQPENVAEWKSIYYNGGHLNALGYNWLAHASVTYIDWIIRHNMNDFRTIQFIGTEYDYS